MSVEFRRASPEDARLLAETRRRAWDTTYRGIYPDAMIDEYDLEAHTARDAARIADPSNAVFLAISVCHSVVNPHITQIQRILYNLVGVSPLSTVGIMRVDVACIHAFT